MFFEELMHHLRYSSTLGSGLSQNILAAATGGSAMLYTLFLSKMLYRNDWACSGDNAPERFGIYDYPAAKYLL